MAKQYVERAPEHHFAQGDAYVMEGVPGPIPFGRNMSAGLSTWAPDPWARWSVTSEEEATSRANV